MIAEKVLNGLPLEDIYIFDAHAHSFENKISQTGGCSCENMLKTMDKIGVNAICVSSMVSICGDPRFGNESVFADTLRYPNRVYGYVVPNPYEEAYSIESFFTRNSSILGIKIHASQQKTSIGDCRYLPAIEFANKNRIPILFHTWTAPEVAEVKKLALQFRECPMIIAHSALTSYEAKREVIATIESCENVWMDTAISSTYDGAIEWIVSRVGADRVIYGSDCSFFDCRQVFGRLALSRLSESDKIKIFGGNAKMIFQRLS